MGKVKILKASAGSGKTYRLAYEYIKGIVRDPLLYRGTLAVTFTNKATEQMKRRIIDSLHALASAPETAPAGGDKVPYLDDLIRETGFPRSLIVRNAAQARTMILHDYSRFAVSTIDKFFQRVVRAFFRELNLDFDYTVEIDRDWILSAAVDRLLERTAADHSLRKAVDRLVEERAEQGKGWDVRPDILRIGAELFRENYEPDPNKAERITEIYNKIVQDISERFAAVKRTAAQAVETIAAAGLEPTDFYQGNRGFAGYLVRLAASERPVTYNSYFLQATESAETWCGKKSPARDRISALEKELMPLLCEVRRGVDALRKDCNTQELAGENLGRSLLLAQLGQEVKNVSAEQNRVMIHETAALIHRIVTGNDAPFIYEKVGNAYSRYMIDEFQDTSENQWHNFVPLLDNALAENDGEPVMLIGDVKQSIYRWRGGDWRILGYEAGEHFAGALAEPVPMDTNWRSERNIVDFNNGLIRRVVECDSALLAEFLEPAPAELKPLAEILRHSYEGFEQRCSPDKLLRPAEGYAEIVPAFREQIGQLMTERIADLLERGYALRDIAVLVRNNREAPVVANVLLEAGYAIVSQEALLLSGSPVVGFVMAVFELADHPEDTVAQAQYNAFLGRPYGAGLPAEESEFIAGLLCCALVESFERILVRYELNRSRDAVSYLQALYQVIVSYSKQTISDVPLLLEWWRENGGKKTIYLPSEQDAITIMTVHKAKGLEFPCVLIPFCDWELLPKSTGGGTTLWATAEQMPEASLFSELGPVPVGYKKSMADSYFAADYYRESVYAHVDNLNLLYVALTRAERELYVMYDRTARGTARVSKLIDAVLPEFGDLRQQTYALPDGSEEVLYAFGIKGEAPQRPAHAAAEETETKRIVLENFPSHDAGQRIRARWSSDRYFGQDSEAVSPRRYGVLMHRLFELLDTPERLEEALVKMRVAGDLTSEAEETLLRERALSALSDPTVARWFSPEWEIVHSERDIIAAGGVRRPDRVMTSGRERAVVVDYKFGALHRADYHAQVSEYMELLREMGYAKVEGYLWFVELGEVERVV
ncbi:UvrD-helicase domain-containing protein [uncultured Rikenella sp.]|uniref:UvrD-helicase domain-containing protein n=1 Tax=uncultured Rikenella sp. TaxID=368003 RepID=UPI0026367CAA|nr:UvrD-helicase domain-containing protein [uncultured Rikenella sp.]